MGLFQQAEGEAAIIVDNGIYKQTDIYTRDGYIYAKASGGFIRLNADGSTTKAKCRLEHISFTSGPMGIDALGRLCMLGVVPKATPLLPELKTKLLGAPD